MNRRPDIPSLTGLRFVAALAVVLMHYRDLLPMPRVAYVLLGKGMTGVGLFFILSGFILTYTYAGRPDGRGFYRARFARVAPLYFLALAGGVGVTAAIGTGLSPAELATSLALNLTALQAWVPWDTGYLWDAPAWSISAEAFFYLIFPLAMRALGWRLPVVALWTALAGLFAAEVITYAALSRLPGWAANLAYYSPASRVWEFLIGCVLATLWMRGLVVGPAMRRALLALAGGWVGFLALAYYGPGDQSVAFTPAYAAIILALASGPSLIGRALSTRSLVLLGEASYALYIVHWLPLRLVGGVAWPVAAVSLVGTVGLSVALYRWVETPVRRWLRSQPARERLHDQVLVQRPDLEKQRHDQRLFLRGG